MEQIIASVRRLNRTGYFSDETDPLNHRDPYFVFKTTPRDGWVDIDFVVEEGRVVNLSLQGGVSSNNGLFGLLSLSMNNFDLFDPPDSIWSTFGEVYRKEAFHGGGQRLTLQISPGAETDSSQIIFVEPDIFGLHRDRWSLTTEASLRERRFEFYDGRRKTLRFSFGRQLGFDSSVSMGLNLREVQVGDVPTDVLSDSGLFSLQQQIGVSQLRALTLGMSTRTTDAATNPKSGRIVTWQNEFALDELGSDWEMFTSKLSWDEYIRIGSPQVDVPSGLRISAGLGVVLPYGETDVAPYSERLFLGGFNSLRGYRFRGVGPNSAFDNAIGGESMARLSVEYRYPLSTQTQPGTLRQIEMFRMHFFVDAGVLGPAADTLDLTETRSAAGFGFALLYPVPLAFNFAWPLEDHFGDNEQVFSFNIAIR
jgi:outer membrane protein insertion porin family